MLQPGPLRVSADRAVSRPVSWGPLIDLHAGRWRVALRYRLTTNRAGDDHWRVNGLYGKLHLSDLPLPPTGDAVGVAQADLTLNRNIEGVEVPTYLAGNATLEILHMRFIPLDGPALPCSD